MIAPELEQFQMNDEQRAIISHKKGPLLVIAGPGSGKTHSLILLAMNLLLCGDAQPSELILCTYTEKAAYEMQDRIASIARKVHYKGDLAELKINTIHGICRQFVRENIHHLPLGSNYEMLDSFTQRLLIVEHIGKICNKHMFDFFTEYWQASSISKIVRNLQFFFDKITEELIFEKLKAAVAEMKRIQSRADRFIYHLTYAYHRYQNILSQSNCLDFAHLQKCVHNLLTNPTAYANITKHLRYILVDEYQDTNYIQEQILRLLAEATPDKNICVVGDEDQALYRFRGATVRNILEFSQNFPECQQVYLTTNYRSHSEIISFCNQWMSTFDWTNSDGIPFRTEKTIRPPLQDENFIYPSVLTIGDHDVLSEAEQVADLILFLKEQKHISDYSQVALLLHSVRGKMSRDFIDALASRNIRSFCSRARTYFEQDEVCLMMGCFARIISYREQKPDNLIEHDEFPDYIRECRSFLSQECQTFPLLEENLQELQNTLAKNPIMGEEPLIDYFYRLVFCEPFASWLADPEKLHNLAVFSRLLQTFHSYYHYPIINQENLPEIEFHLFHRFFSLLYEDGINQYEEDDQKPFPAGHVQIMTIHQAKGLEFPVVIVGRLDKPPPGTKNDDRYLQSFYHRPYFEPVNRIPGFDVRRLYYVAFSRAQHLLILTAHKRPHKQFAMLWEELPTWQYSYGSLQALQAGKLAPVIPLKARYSFTGHIRLYATCPRQFYFFREQQFASAHPADVVTGLLVHQTLERLHRLVLEEGYDNINEQKVEKFFSKVFNFLTCRNAFSIHPNEKSKALQQVKNYVYHNYADFQRIEATEWSVQVEREHYILTGTIDLLRRGDEGLEILDFKTGNRPAEDAKHLLFYKQQLYLYAYALEKRKKQPPQRLLLYWTAEEHPENALMEIPYNPDDVQQVHLYFDTLIDKIKHQQFQVQVPPHPEICRKCPLRHLCRKEGIF